MTIDGWTIALQTVNFLVLVWLLRRFLWRPVLAVIAAREAEEARIHTAAAAERTAAEEARRAVENDRAALEAERAGLLAEAHTAAEAERAALAKSAQAEADRLLADTRARLAQERADALAGLKDHAVTLAAALAGRLVADVAADATPVLFARACDALAAEPDERRAHLLPPGEALTVVAAHPVDAATRAAWGAHLSAVLGRPVPLDIHTDPALVAGVELHFPALVLAQSWRGVLDAAVAAERARKEPADAEPLPIP